MSRRTLLVYRAPEYSPNNIQKDAAILDAVASLLRLCPDASVDACAEETLPADLECYDVILHMTRRLSSLVRLENLHHPIVINAPRGVRNVAKSRELTLMLLQAVGVRVPDWWAYDPEADEMFMCDAKLGSLLPGWVKAMRSDGAQSGDVTYVSSPLHADSLIIELASQRIPDIVVTKHIDGDLIKCYYVEAPDPYIHWFYPQETGYSKFGGEAESHNSRLSYIRVSREPLLQIAAKIGQGIGLDIFGFDAIVQPPVTPTEPPLITVIDVNDWPSFSPCKEEAAAAIVNMLI